MTTPASSSSRDARLSWTLDANQALWAAVSRAERTPSRIDRDLVNGTPPYLVVLEGGSGFTSEAMIAYELGYRVQLSSRLTTSVSGFYNQYNGHPQHQLHPGHHPAAVHRQQCGRDTYGLEFSGNYQVSDGWSLHAGYTLLSEHLRVKPGQYDLSNALNETADPKHQLSLRSSLNLPWHTEFDAGLRWVDRLLTNNGPTPGTVPSYVELNARLAWHASARLELSLVGQNLLHDHHPEYGFPDPTRAQIQRSVYGKLAWRY